MSSLLSIGLLVSEKMYPHPCWRYQFFLELISRDFRTFSTFFFALTQRIPMIFTSPHWNFLLIYSTGWVRNISGKSHLVYIWSVKLTFLPTCRMSLCFLQYWTLQQVCWCKQTQWKYLLSHQLHRLNRPRCRCVVCYARLLSALSYTLICCFSDSVGRHGCYLGRCHVSVVVVDRWCQWLYLFVNPPIDSYVLQYVWWTNMKEKGYKINEHYF